MYSSKQQYEITNMTCTVSSLFMEFNSKYSGFTNKRLLTTAGNESPRLSVLNCI